MIRIEFSQSYNQPKRKQILSQRPEFDVLDKASVTVVFTADTPQAYALQTAPDTPQTEVLQASASQQGRSLVIMAIMFQSS